MNKQKTVISPYTIALLISAIAIFQVTSHFHSPATTRVQDNVASTVVISAPIQVVMYAGDRFLAANFEAFRVAAIGPTEEEKLANYRRRAHRLVSQLNACHEDNYYLANAMLSWGGAVDDGNYILERASDCRYWDDIPSFFLGFNRYFFYRDINGAIEAINTAASRSVTNRTSLQQMSIIMSSKKLNDEKMAVAYLRQQRDETKDKKLVEMLERRISRIEGLILLRDAHARYMEKFDKPINAPHELVSSGILEALPHDPMRIGYEFVDGQFRMRAMKIGGVEIRQ